MAERRTLAAIAVVALALGLAGYGWWSRAPVTPPDPRIAAPDPVQAVPVDVRPADRTAARKAAGKPAPLPPPGTPIAQIAGPLQARADAGDSRAACRLAIELLRCQHLEQSRSMQWAGGVPPDVSLARRGNLDAADRFAEMEIRKIQLGQHCQAVDPALVAQAARYLASAARAGEPEAMVRYATGAHHGILGQMDYIRDADFERWRRDAPAMLLRAAQAGRMDAARELGHAYRTDRTPATALFPDDPLQAHAWALLVARLMGSATPAFESNDAAIQVEATALASQWHQRHFDNAVLGSDRSALSLWPLDSPYRPVEDERFCE